MIRDAADLTAQVRSVIAATRRAGRTALTERESLDVLDAFGVPVARSLLVRERTGIAAAARSLRWPLALKIESPDIVHKSDIGGVRLGCRDVADAETAYDEIVAAARTAGAASGVSGVLLQEQATGIAECFIGARVDPEFGPVVGFGLGGIFVEVLDDVTWRAAPFDAREASRAIGESLASAVLGGWRGHGPGDEAAMADCLAATSRLMWDLRDEIEDLDVNPVLVRAAGDGVIAVDAFIRLADEPHPDIDDAAGVVARQGTEA
jgi:acetate---CoA ligase (ADP-forming)